MEDLFHLSPMYLSSFSKILISFFFVSHQNLSNHALEVENLPHETAYEGFNYLTYIVKATNRQEGFNCYMQYLLRGKKNKMEFKMRLVKWVLIQKSECWPGKAHRCGTIRVLVLVLVAVGEIIVKIDG